VGTPLSLWGGKSSILPVPKGTVLIIAPWNYPVQLTLAPLVGALAAGNTAILKPSELAPRTAAALAEILEQSFPDEWVAVVEGDGEVAGMLLDLPFDHFFFTGSQRVGRIVMEKAAGHLSPVTLELGGKSPAIVHRDARLELAARRIAWGKTMNAGQTCVAPDYLLVDETILEPLVEFLKDEFSRMAPSLEEPGPRLINEAHFQRLQRHLEDPENGLFWGGQRDAPRLRIQPALLRPKSFRAPIMQEEIFGPLLPILSYREPEKAREAILTYAPNPLALYVFSENPTIQKMFVEGVPFGGGAINDTLVHLANPELPFGGIRQSGFGAYHGEAGFLLFSHQKSILEQTTSFDLPFRYRRDPKVVRWFRRFMR
ncbi:MAG: aldehyde dehydrogenase family protein, partial [Bacillota bacterium]|nr:aldehyde dehydrogenase family protein [Bacillota bacterium]